MTTSTSFAQMANNLLNVLQGCSKTIRLLLVMFVTLTVSANTWGAIASGTYVLCTSTSDLEAGAHYIIASGTSGSVYCISNASQSNYRGRVSATVSNDKITVASNSTIMTFTLGGSTGEWTFYTDNYAGTAGYLASAAFGSDNYCRVISTSTTGTISISSNVATIVLNPHSTRKYLKYNSSASRFACYSSGQADVYLYKLAASCDKKVTIVKGTPETGGSFNLDKTGAQDCCSALTVTVSNITAPSGKEFDAITQSGIATGVTINQSAKTVTYAANSTGTSTINVTFRDLQKYTVTLKDNDETLAQASAGASVTLPSRAGCTGYTFAGWTKTWVAPQSSWTTTAPTIIPAGSYTPSANENLYPVYTKTESGGSSTASSKSISSTSTSAVTLETGKPITYTCSESNTYSDPARIYKTKSITIAGGTITSISLTGVSGYAISNMTANTGTLTTNGNNGTWTGSASSITFTASTAQTRISAISVTYSGGSTTSYISVPDCGDPCASLQAPNVTATATENSITLSWAAVPDATSYNVYNYTTEDLDETTSLTYTFTGLSSETEYEWGVESAKGECFKETRGTTTTQEACTDAVNVMKGTPSNGSFTMVSGYQSTCNGPVTVTLSNIEPATGYQFSAITQTGINSGVTIDNNNKTVTYAKNTTGNSTINVTFIKIPKYTVTLNPNYPNGKTGTFTYEEGELVDGNLVFTYDYNTASKTLADLYTSLTLDGYEFGGWYNAKGLNPGEVSGSKCTETNTITGDKIYYAKWSKLYSITLSENGTTTELTPQTSTSYTLPTELTAGGTCQDDTKELVGWSTVEILNPGDKPTSKFCELGATVTLTEDQTTFYAVFATPEGGGTENVEATLSFASTAQRNSQTTERQVWSNDGITFTNNKASSTTNVANYSNPVRLYKNSEIIVEHTSGKITKIVFDCNTDAYAYATALKNSIGTPNNTTVTASSDKVTVTFSNAVESFSAKLTSDQVRLDALTVTYTTSGGTSYSDYTTTCVALPDPVISFVTTPADPIVFDPVNCGSTTSKAQAKTVRVSGENLRDVVNVSVTGPYKIARTSSTALNAYTTSLTLDKTAAGAIHSNYQTVYIISTPPAQSTEATTGTLTFTTTKGNTLTVNLSTPTVTCTQYTLTLVDRGVSTEQPTKYYAGETINEAPADPEGVCTDPIHYVFDGWAEAEVSSDATSYSKVSFPYEVTGNTTLYAVYRYLEGGGNGDYNLVTSALDDWSGDYLIANSNQIFANGTIGGSDGIGAKNNKVDLSSNISNNTIPATVGDQYNVTLEAVTGGYVLKTQDGKYNYHTNNTGNGISASTIGYADDYPITVKFVSEEEINLCLGGNAIGSVFRYNTDGYFRFYKNGGQQPVYLYKKADGTTYYTTSPVCGPHLAITEGKEIYVTGGNAGGTRDLVIAQQKVSYKATRLNVGPTSQVPDVKVATNGITVGGVVTQDVKVTIDQTKEQQTDGTYTITGTITVQYQPSANNKQEDIQVQLAVDYNAEARDNFTVHARSLPAEFVIVAKSGDKWYALNGDMNNGSSANPANGQVTLNDDANPTKATYAPCNAIYTFDGVPNTGDRTYVRFQGTGGAWLWAASGTNVGIQNKSLKDTPEGNNKAYNWKLETEDNITYKFHNDNSSRLLGLSGEKFGMYASAVQELRILPYIEKCLYNYAPTNLKVSVLKGTYVTLTWDAVAGATKYQYRTDATNWTDAGTEPTMTINGLDNGTNYTYYIRAYHADAGVSQECFDYSEVSFTTADCDDVPTDITYTADLNSITVSWTAAAPTATIKLFMNEDGTGGGGTYPGATSPYTISGGLNKNTTYYIQILSDGTCASPIIPVKTEDVEVDIVEWYPQGIIVDINTDETVGVTLENEVSYGSGLGSLAEDLFFSKYFEGSGSLKMIAIYNGTGKDVDLTDYFIYKGHDGSANIDADDEDKILYPLSELGVIKQGQEIVLYSWPLNTDAEASVYSCSQTFLHSIANESGQDANPRWILCGKDPTNSITPIYSDAMNFNGDDPLLLYKDDEIIDVFGATEGESPEDNVICDGYNENGNYKTRRDESWVANDVSNMDYGKTAEDFPGGEIPDDVNVDDPTITAYTARVIMFRKNTVTSGTNAVTKNTDDFHTFAEEWEVRQVCRVSGDGDLTCAAYQELGTFDYSDYYTKYESMGEGTTFEENDRNADGTVTIPITDLYKHACSNIRVKLTNSNGDVLTDREYKVPIMITTTQGTDGQAFIDLRQNLATKEVDGEGNVIATHPLSLEDVREICKTCDVVVRNNATLTKVTDGTDNDHPQVRNVYVYENSSLIVPNGTNYTINNLSLRRKGDKVSSLSAYPDALKLPESAAAPISLDFRLSAENWHWFTLPYNCNINEVTWADGTPAQYNTDWYLMTYDGEKRAETQAGGCWKAYTGTTINAGDGFIIAINGNINNPAHTYELHFPMSKEVLAAEGIDKIVAVRAWGVETNIRPNHKGWNLVGNPYLAYYQRNNITNFEGLRLGQLTGPDPQTGYWEQTGDVPYVVVPVGAGWIAYEQVLASETDLLPFTAYFVQVGNDGKHDSSDELSISFDHTKLQLSATPMPASIVRRAPSEVNETEEPVIVGVALTNSLGESDKTSLVIADRFTNEYEMQADFFKWFGDYYNYYTKPVLYTIGADQGKRAFNALNEELAKQPIPMGMYAAQAGNYTFSLNQQFDLSRVEEVWLYDATQSTYTNLMQSDYTFSTSKVNGVGRFSLSVKLAPKVATSIDNVTADKVWATTHNKQVIVNGLENGMHLWLYDATGKLLYNEPTSNYQHTYAVPQTGTYFVSVMNGNQKQTIKVVVE